MSPMCKATVPKPECTLASGCSIDVYCELLVCVPPNLKVEILTSILQCDWKASHYSQSWANDFFFFFKASLQGMWDLISLTRDRTCTPCSGSAEF